MIDSTALLRCAIVPLTLLAEASRRLSSSSREAMVLESRLRPSRAALTSGGLSLNSVARVVSDFASASVSISLRRGRQVGEGVDDVVGRDGPLERDLAVLLELSTTGRLEGEVLRAQQGLHPHAGAGAGAEGHRLGDLEVDHDPVAGEVDLLHLADLDPGDADVVALDEPTGLAERRAVVVAAADERDALDVEGQEQDQADGQQAGGADRDGVALAEGSAHDEHLAADRPAGLSTGILTAGAPLTGAGSDDRAAEVAQVEVEPGAVGGRPGDRVDLAR